MEADPGTFDLARIKGYQDVGIQRFSVGIQAFDEVRLLCERPSSTAVSMRQRCLQHALPEHGPAQPGPCGQRVCRHHSPLLWPCKVSSLLVT